MMVEKEYDVVIIGAGMGGLGAGLTIQAERPELQMLIVEQHSIPGGYVTGFHRKGIYFDAGAEGIIYAGEGQVFKEELEKLEIKQEFIRIDPLEVLNFPDKKIVMHADINDFRQELVKHYPENEKELTAYFEDLIQMTEEFWNFGPTELDRSIWKLTKFAIKSPTILKYSQMSFQKYLEKRLSNPELHTILSFYNLWLGVAPKDIMAPKGVIVGGNPYIHGNYYPKGGMLAFAKKLAEVYEKRGGTIRYKAEVEKILVKDKKAKGVKLSTGEAIKAKMVIANSDPKYTLDKLLGKKHISRRTRTTLSNLRPSISGFGIFLGVDMDLSHYPSHITIMKDYEEMINPIVEGKFPMKGIAIRIPSNIDSSLESEKGTGVVIFTLAPYRWHNYWNAGEKLERGEEYKQLKEQYAQKILSTVDKAIPGLSDNIIVQEIATPLTFERYSLNAAGGWYGPHDGQKKHKLKHPVNNLILTGANVDSPGVPTAFISGVKTARKVLKKELE